MKGQRFFGKYGNWIVVALTLIVNTVFLSIRFDFYYDLNDDVMMKDIMAGVYTGTPDGHNMQTLYVLGAFISLWYRLCRSIPWYGLFLFLCQMAGLYLIGVRLLRFCKRRPAKAGCLLLLSVFLWGIVLTHMIAIQYTVTCTMLASAAIFLFMTTERELTPKQFISRNVPAIVLAVLAYQLRTEMLLLIFPFICLAGLFRWMEEEKIFQRENYIKYGTVLGCIVAGMALGRMIDFAAYGSGEWKAFLNFFNQRTEVYDFHYDILTSGEHEEYLSSIGLNAAQQELLANYNFGLDEEIDGEVLEKIAVYASEDAADKAALGDGTSRMREWLGQIYKNGKLSAYRLLWEKEDMPYSRLVLFGYLGVIVCGFAVIFSGRTVTGKSRRGRWNFLWELALLALFRTCLWLYLLMRNRAPVRITHSLYLAELMVLMGLLGIQLLHLENARRLWRPCCAALLGVLCICNLPHSVTAVMADMDARAEANHGSIAIAEYCKAHPDNFYFEDVYSTVGFSQEIFKNVDNSIANYDIMGGWMCKSPLYREKLEYFDIPNMEEGLLCGDSVYYIAETGDEADGTDWMQAYYESKGIFVVIEQVDSIGEQYGVYRVVQSP